MEPYVCVRLVAEKICHFSHVCSCYSLVDGILKSPIIVYSKPLQLVITTFEFARVFQKKIECKNIAREEWCSFKNRPR
jgi:hypothetical protein